MPSENQPYFTITPKVFRAYFSSLLFSNGSSELFSELFTELKR
jgi:hypothetical protein